MSLSTHVLDASSGQPAVGVRIELLASDGVTVLMSDVTDSDGRVRAFGEVRPGRYQLVFDTGAYFAGFGVATFYPDVTVTFEVGNADSHYHVPLLLSPFAYSTYRGT